MSNLDWLLAAQENSGTCFILSRRDYEDLKRLVDAWPAHEHPVRRLLVAKLWRGLVCDPDQVPDDVVVAGARIEYRRAPRGEIETGILVRPDVRPMPANGISMVSPLGALLLGMIQGAVIHQSAPDGVPFFLHLEKVTRRDGQSRAPTSIAADGAAMPGAASG